MENLLDTKIQTDRLILTPISEIYREQVFQEFTLEITRYMNPKPAENISQTDVFIKESIENMQKGEELVVAIVQKDTGEFIGCAGLHHINTKTPELGVWTKKSAHGNKYGREALTALKNWADENLNYEYISYPVDKQNIASRKIPESLGGIVAREMKKINASGQELDEVEYKIYKK